jgi:hypothetical protein
MLISYIFCVRDSKSSAKVNISVVGYTGSVASFGPFGNTSVLSPNMAIGVIVGINIVENAVAIGIDNNRFTQCFDVYNRT